MKTYLVTGGAGFIGSNFIKFLATKYGKDIQIINIDSLTYAGNIYNLEGVDQLTNYKFMKTSINDKEAIEKVFKNYNIDYVINFAAESHVDRSIISPEEFIETNIKGTFNLIENARKSWVIDFENNKYKDGVKYIQISTDEVYGSLGKDGFFTEKTPLDPNSPYSSSKAAADLLVKAYCETYDFPMNITRCSNNYGPNQFPEKLIPIIVNKCLRKEKIPVYGNGKNIRDWLYVDDHCEAIECVLKKGEIGEIYNIGGHNEKENIEIVKIVINYINKNHDSNVTEDLISFTADRKGHDHRYAIDPSKIKNDLDWSPKTRFEEGIVRTIKWILENQEWQRKIETGEYMQH
ncbi:dTDP-glucose 4,6-dehydratase [Virgibacillus soli]|uniref:dTDP-glucose 4,6-dehydratase n=1 Tax=Paracerasibacillus soli TaxID=480284 RepID=UPI0035E90F4C